MSSNIEGEISKFINLTISEFQKGTNPFMVPSTLQLPKYKDWKMYDQWLEMNVWRVLLDEWMGPFPWRPDQAYQKISDK